MAESSKSFIEAIETKYSPDSQENLGIEIFVPKSAPGQKKTGEIVLPQELSLDQEGIGHAGNESKISTLCDGVTLLDLSENNIAEWEEVFKILNALPVCSFLNLKSNPLSHQMKPPLDKQFPNLSNIILNDLKLPWSVITQILQILPNLQELHLSQNEYSCVELAEHQTYPQLLTLHINNNNLENWLEVIKLGKIFPNLETLMLLQNPLGELPSVEDMTPHFTKLTTISISSTKIPNWEQLQKFKYFPSLTHLRSKGLEFLEEYEEELRRQLILAYLPNLTVLNGGTVTDGERDAAERTMMRHYMDIGEPYPQRYHELEAKHGKLQKLVEVNLAPKTKVTVTVKCEDSHSFLKELDVSWTRQDLMRAIEHQAGIQCSKMVLLHKDKQSPQEWTSHMIYPTRTVLRYGINDGDEIIVNVKMMQNKVYGSA